ncbi:MAG: molybdenum cofactor guanylyltransferase, partial [Planctomycetia bacterium]
MTKFEATACAACLIACGGRSRRMGRPKADLIWNGRSFLRRVAGECLAAAPIVVAAAAVGQTLDDLPSGVRIARDDRPDEGPLAGLAAGFAALRDVADDGLVFVTGCDAPLLTAAWIGFLCGRIGDAKAAVPFVDGRWQPLSGVYRKETAAVVADLLRRGRRRLVDFVEEIAATAVGAEELKRIDPDLRPLWNVNTPEEYERLLRTLPD